MMAQTPTDAILEAAGKCQNPVVRNALLSVAASGKAEELAKRIAKRTRRAWSDAIDRLGSATWAGFENGRRDDPSLLAELGKLDAKVKAAESDYKAAENALQAIREAERGDGKPYGALISEYDAAVSEYGAMEKVRKRLAEA